MEMQSKQDLKRNAVLGVLKEAPGPFSSRQIVERLMAGGQDLSERSVRLYLRELEERGHVESLGRKGRLITEEGRRSAHAHNLMQRVGFMSAMIDQIIYQMDFDLATRAGNVVVNLALIPRDAFKRHLPEVMSVFERGYAMGQLAGVLRPGEKLGETVVPEGMVGFCPVCSITLNGVLLKHGVPMRMLFSGLFEFADGRPRRFKELINYEATSIDPLELFIKGRMTDYIGAITDGCGTIGAGFREIPAQSRDLVESLAKKLDDIGLGAFLKVGMPNRDLFNVPVHNGCCGVVVIGGLNPVAIFEENGVSVQLHALSGLMEYNRLVHYSQLGEML